MSVYLHILEKFLLKEQILKSKRTITLLTSETIVGDEARIKKTWYNQGSLKKTNRSVFEGMSRSVPEGVSRSVPEGMSRSVPEGMSRSVPEGMSRSVPEGMSRSVPS
ncbi:hypothetical protein Tco_1137422 [Tanacetum coccineum]